MVWIRVGVNISGMEAPSWLKKFNTSVKGKSKRPRSPLPTIEKNINDYEKPHGSSATNVYCDEPEYMGDSVLMAEVSSEHNKSSSKKPMISKQKPLKEIMHVALEEGLEKPLDQSNLGFKMVEYNMPLDCFL